MMSEKNTGLHNICLFIYVSFMAGGVMQFAESTLLAGLVLLIVGYFVLALREKAATGTLYESHLRWLNRTFWIGSAVIVPIATIAGFLLILNNTDMSALMAAQESGDPEMIASSISAYIEQNGKTVSLITLATGLPTGFWWLRRCWAGFSRLQKGLPVEKVTSWL